MEMEFACPTCGRSYTLSPELGGKLARCKQCQTVNRLPMPGQPSTMTPSGGRSRPGTAPRTRTAPGPDSVDDPFGFNDMEAPAGGDKSSAAPLYSYDESPVVVPRRAPARDSGGARRESKGAPWGVTIRQAAISLTIAGFLANVLRIITLDPSVPENRVILTLRGLIILIGMALTVISVLGAAISFFSGNRQAFRSETLGQAIGWYGSIFWTILFAYLLYALVHSGQIHFEQ